VLSDIDVLGLLVQADESVNDRQAWQLYPTGGGPVWQAAQAGQMGSSYRLAISWTTWTTLAGSGSPDTSATSVASSQ
jgi:hypothetical protein